MKTKLFILIFLLFSNLINTSFMIAKPIEQLPDAQTSHNLKQLMAKFGVLISGVEIMQAKEKKPDWPILEDTFKEMRQVLNEMKQIDTTSAYIAYTSLLEKSLTELEKKTLKKDKKFLKVLILSLKIASTAIVFIVQTTS